MTADYSERRSLPAQPAAMPGGSWFSNRTTNAPMRTSIRMMPRFFCGLWFSFLLAMWPSSDWIGLLALSQALFAAACLLKTSSAPSGAGSSARQEPIGMEEGEDRVH